jgi:hypothetical protein
MAEVGPFVTIPRAGAYCQIALDSGEKVIVNHDKGGFAGGRLTIEVPKFMGVGADRIYICDLDSPEGKAILTGLTRGVPGELPAGVVIGPGALVLAHESVPPWCAWQS